MADNMNRPGKTNRISGEGKRPGNFPWAIPPIRAIYGCMMNTHASLRCLLVACAVAASSNVTAGETEPRDDEIAQLKQQIANLEARILALERTAGTQTGPANGIDAGEKPSTGVPIAAKTGTSGAERTDEADLIITAAQAENRIDFKGALRFTAYLDEGSNAAKSKRGQSGLDIFRIGADGVYDDFQISAEYRYYPYMHTIHHGWVGYRMPDTGQLQFGISQVPFGILPYASHNFWFGAPYYLGLSDDYDLGLKWIRQDGPWNLQLAFYKNAELGDASNLNRYSFDVVRVGNQQNEETNQFNARIARTLEAGLDSLHEIGLSLQAGQLYNTLTDDTGNHWALAAHLDSRYRRWNLQLQLARYAYNPKNPPGVSDDTMQLGAFAASYPVASEATVGVVNVAYNLPVSIPGIDQVLLYNDYSFVLKDNDAYADSHLNTTGAALGVGPLFLYLDLIQSKNMVFLGNGSLAGGGDDSWHRRLNLNVGYYW